MTVNILFVSTGYSNDIMTYPIRVALATAGFPGVHVGLVCQDSEDFKDIDIFLYKNITDRHRMDKAEIDNLVKHVGYEWDFIFAGSDSVVELSMHLSTALGKPLFGFFMGYPITRLSFPVFQELYTHKLKYFSNYVSKTFMPSYQSLERAKMLGYTGQAVILPLGVEDYETIKPTAIELDDNYKGLIVTINRDADHKNLEDFFVLADRYPEYQFMWITSQPKSQVLRSMQPANLIVNSASDKAKFQLLKQADLFVFTSWDEGYLLSCMEALGCETPVLVKASKLSYELLWQQHKAGVVDYYDSPHSIALELILSKPKNDLEYNAPSLVSTTTIIIFTSLNDIKAQKVNAVFNDKFPPSSQQVSTLYDFMDVYDQAMIKIRGLDDPYHPDNWKYYFTSVEIEGEKICDLGCGSGSTTRKLLDDNYTVFGLDISKRTIGRLENLFESEISNGDLKLEQFDATNPHDVGKFDTVICEEVLEHVTSPQKVIETVLGMATKKAVFTTPIEHAADDPGHIQHFTRDDIEIIFSEFTEAYTILEMGNPNRPDSEPSHFLIAVDLKPKEADK